jgi:hypothetical protein
MRDLLRISEYLSEEWGVFKVKVYRFGLFILLKRKKYLKLI